MPRTQSVGPRQRSVGAAKQLGVGAQRRQALEERAPASHAVAEHARPGTTRSGRACSAAARRRPRRCRRCRDSRRRHRRRARGSRGSAPARRRTSRARRRRRGSSCARRSTCTTRSPTTHCARSLSGVQMQTLSTVASALGDARRRGERVVGLELDHRPDDDAHRGERVLERMELREQRRLDAGRGLVAGPQVVAERLDRRGRWRRRCAARPARSISSTDCSTPTTAPSGRSLPLLKRRRP